MKKILFISLCFSSYFSFSQTSDEVEKIKAEYDFEYVNTLKNELIISYDNNQSAIDNVLLNSNLKRSFISDGKNYFLRKVIGGTPLYYTTDNVNAAKSTRTNFLNTGGSLGLNLDGQNMRIATWDGGPTLVTHVEFYNTLNQSRVNTPDASASNSQSQHSTHVSGTIIAKGTNPLAKGMAPQAVLTSYDWDNDSFEVLTDATQNGLLISNHSYGIPVFINGNQNAPTWLMGSYSSESREWDLVSHAAPYYLCVVSAGNDGSSSYTGGLLQGYDKLTGNKTSKNNLVVANAEDAVIHPNGSGVLLGTLFINSSSSQGPADDGRIKPDITGNGTNVLSTSDSSNSSYVTLSGTSMSAPNVSGTLLLLQQYYNQLNSTFMLSSTLKALACHTADDAGNIGPDPIFGWGLLNAKKAAELIERDFNSNQTALIKEDILPQGQTHQIEVSVSSGQKLEATLCWTDVAGNAINNQVNSSTPALVNNLDLRIKKSSDVFFPWKLQLTNVAGAAIKGDNNVDNVEKVEVDNPSGSYIIEITHKGNLSGGAQQYSLVVSGADLTLSNESYDSRSNFMIYPNPSNGIFNVEYNFESSKRLIQVFDIQGRVVLQSSPIEFISTIDLSSHSKGLYVIKCIDGEKISNKKIILK